jgi:diaminopimelate decarboxylase
MICKINQYNELTAFPKVDKHSITCNEKHSNVAILQLLKEMGSGLDTVSIHRASCGLRTRKNFCTPNGVSLEEMKVNAMGVQINIDSDTSLEQFGAKHQMFGMLISINPLA